MRDDVVSTRMAYCEDLAERNGRTAQVYMAALEAEAAASAAYIRQRHPIPQNALRDVLITASYVGLAAYNEVLGDEEEEPGLEAYLGGALTRAGRTGVVAQ